MLMSLVLCLSHKWEPGFTDRYGGQCNMYIFLELHCQRFSSTGIDSGSVDFIFANWPLGFGRNCAFFRLWDFSREKIRKTAALFLTRDDTVNVDSIYGDELRIDHIYRSLNKCHSFTCPSELRSFAVIVRGFVSRLFNHR